MYLSGSVESLCAGREFVCRIAPYIIAGDGPSLSTQVPGPLFNVWYVLLKLLDSTPPSTTSTRSTYLDYRRRRILSCRTA